MLIYIIFGRSGNLPYNMGLILKHAIRFALTYNKCKKSQDLNYCLII